MQSHLKALLACLIFSQTLWAYEISEDSVQLKEIVVTGTKFETSRELVPLSVSQINETEIKRSGHYNALSIVGTYVPGVFITERNILGFGVSTGGSGIINMRGVGNSPNTQVLVLIDGHPQYQGIFAHPLPDAYVASDVEKIEVIRGPASVLYGSNAMAGAINFITKKQRKEGLSVSAQAAYGSYNTQKYTGTIGYNKNNFSIFASGNHDRTDGIRPGTDFKISNGYIKAGYRFNPHWSITADANVAKFFANDSGPVHNPAHFDVDILRGKAALSVDNRYGKLNGSFKFYHNFGKHVLSDGFQSTDQNSGLMLYQTYMISDDTKITAGMDAKMFGGTANSGMAANKLNLVTELAGYVLAYQKIFKIVDLNGGLRFEHHSVYGNEWVPMAGASVQASPTTNFKTSVSKGFRSPTVMDLYLYAPNPDLKPESMMNYELGWMQSYLNHKLRTELTLFLVDGKNMIEVDRNTMPPIRRNTGKFRNKGIEFSTSYNINKQWQASANYTFLDVKKPILAAPRHQVNFNLNYQYKFLNVNANLRHIHKLHVSVNPEKTQNYTLLNMRISAKLLKQLELFASAHNILNQQYEINYGYPMPGINFHGGLNFNL